jgi:hypothetical protein
MKRKCFIATTSAASELCDIYDAPCYTMLSQDVRMSSMILCLVCT